MNNIKLGAKMKCQTCKDLSYERKPPEIESVRTHDGGYYDYSCVILYCPVCGKKIEYTGKQ